jgi:dihydroorotate dehydrogenase (fumarate)
MSLKTKYMGIELSSPVIVGSSSLTNSTDNLKKAEDYGAGAVVIKSLFEEQILADSGRKLKDFEIYHWYPEAVMGIEGYSENDLIEHYLNLISFAKNNLKIPVFASVNCVSAFDWPQFAMKFEEVGADGIELNIVVSPADESSSGDEICLNISNIINAVRSNCTIPVSIKLAPYFTNLNTAIRQLDETGVDGMVLFNKLFSPDIDIDTISVVSDMQLNNTGEINTALRWISLLSGNLNADIVGSGGVRDFAGVIKYILAGAKAVQTTSSLLLNELEYISEINAGIENWMKEKGFNSIEHFRGLISNDTEAKKLFRRVQYLRFD